MQFLQAFLAQTFHNLAFGPFNKLIGKLPAARMKRLDSFLLLGLSMLDPLQSSEVILDASTLIKCYVLIYVIPVSTSLWELAI